MVDVEERLAVVEEKLDGLEEKVEEVGEDIKIVKQYQSKQVGFIAGVIAAFALLFTLAKVGWIKLLTIFA